MTVTPSLIATADGKPAGTVGAIRFRLPLALTCFAASIVFATVAAASTPLLSWMGEPADPATALSAVHETSVHLRDGSIRTRSSANTARWHPGDRIMLIRGVMAAAL